MINILKQLEDNNSNLKKLEILGENKDDELFKKVLFYTYNKNYKYNVKKYNEPTTRGNVKLEDKFEVLDLLRTRQVTGNAAIQLVENTIADLNDGDAEVFKRILNKDLKCRINIKMINKVFEGLIEVYPYMGAISYDPKKFAKIKYPVYAEIKYDGEFINLLKENNKIRTISRSGKDLHLEDFFTLPDDVDNVVITGELLIDDVDRYKANGMINSLKQIMVKIKSNKVKEKELNEFYVKYNMTPEELGAKLYVVAWDIIPINDYYTGEYNVALYKRREQLEEIVSEKISVCEYRELNKPNEVFEYFNEALNRGEEGLILKEKNSFWKDGKPNYIQKFKLIIDLDLECVDTKNGNKDTQWEKYVNRLILKTSDGELNVTASGISEDMMIDFTKNSPIGKIVTIRCNGISKDRDGNYSLLHPRIIEVRNDKDKANTLNECLEIEDAAKKLKEK